HTTGGTRPLSQTIDTRRRRARVCKCARTNSASAFPKGGERRRRTLPPKRADRHRKSRSRLACMIIPLINPEIIEPMPLGKTVEPVHFRDRVRGIVLRAPRAHGGELGEGGTAGGGVLGFVPLDQLLEKVGAFENNAAAGRRLGELAEVVEKR